MKNRELTSQSKVDKPKRMSAREHAIEILSHRPRHPTESDFDRAINLMDAEGPTYVANAAVNDLRKWQEDGNDG